MRELFSLGAYLDELEARRVAFTAMTNDPRISEDERAVWKDRLEGVERRLYVEDPELSRDMDLDKWWLCAEQNAAIMLKVLRFAQ